MTLPSGGKAACRERARWHIHRQEKKKKQAREAQCIGSLRKARKGAGGAFRLT